jgi:hypothetical protein
MKTIWKYELKGDAPYLIDLPKNAELILFEVIENRWFIWCEVNVSEEVTVTREFKVVGTGWEYSNEWFFFSTTFSDPPFVWHLLENVGIYK